MGLGKWVGQPICGTLWHYTQVFKILLMKKYGIKQEIVGWPVCWPTRWFLGDFQHHGGGDPARIPMWNVHGNHCIIIYGYGSIPINTIFSGMNIHLPAILMFTRGTRFWHTAISSMNLNHDFEIWHLILIYWMMLFHDVFFSPLIWVLWWGWVKLFISMKLDG